MRRSLVLGPLTLVLALTLTGCGSGGGSNSAKSAQRDIVAGASTDSVLADKAEPAHAVSGRAVISTGSIELTSKDVAGVRDRIASVLVAHDGFLADERTSTDRKGRTSHARLVLRVPADDFTGVMAEVSGFGHLQDSSRKSEDVTTQVIDTDQRVRAQRIGLRRIEVLLGRAGSLRDVLRIEDQITSRRADLDSLRQQQAWLRSQTSLATITVTVDQTSAAPVEQAGGFLGGLDAGWHGLRVFVTAALTAVGAVLPFTLLVLVLALLSWPVRRTLRRRRVVTEPAQPTG